MTTNILFLCPHAAAKSVFAMTYFEDLAAKADLDVSVSNAGTEPDATAAPKVAAWLENEGFDLEGFVPPLLTDVMLDSADIVVSIGCISAEAVPPNTRYLDWSDVPQPSQDLEGSRNAIYAYVEGLIEELNA